MLSWGLVISHYWGNAVCGLDAVSVCELWSLSAWPCVRTRHFCLGRLLLGPRLFPPTHASSVLSWVLGGLVQVPRVVFLWGFFQDPILCPLAALVSLDSQLSLLCPGSQPGTLARELGQSWGLPHQFPVAASLSLSPEVHGLENCCFLCCTYFLVISGRRVNLAHVTWLEAELSYHRDIDTLVVRFIK